MTTGTKIQLDLRRIPPGQHRALALRTFDGLAPGEAFALVAPDHPRAFVQDLQAKRPLTFDASLFEAAPGRFRLRVARRQTPGPRSVTEYLMGDHRRLDALLAKVVHLTTAGRLAEAAARFAEFRCGLDWHIDAEEHVLFPAVEGPGGPAPGPTTAMRVEHVGIRRLIEAVAEALERKNAAGARGAISALIAVLASHNVKEERVLYPMIDRSAGERERLELVRRMQAL